MSMLAFTETPAPVVILSPAKRIALLECHLAGRLDKLRGFWSAPGTLARIAGVTVADLSRDGLMVVNSTTYRKDVARLSDRGAWFARTLAAALP